jgi:hypothetical protein
MSRQRKEALVRVIGAATAVRAWDETWKHVAAGRAARLVDMIRSRDAGMLVRGHAAQVVRVVASALESAREQGWGALAERSAGVSLDAQDPPPPEATIACALAEIPAEWGPAGELLAVSIASMVQHVWLYAWRMATHALWHSAWHCVHRVSGLRQPDPWAPAVELFRMGLWPLADDGVDMTVYDPPMTDLQKLAFTMGFDADQVWGDPSNADLKQQRQDGDILLPGDVLYVPDDPPKKLPFTKESENPYKAKLPTVTVKIVLTGPGGDPLANEPYVVKGTGAPEEEKTTGADGSVTFEAPIHLRQADLVLTKKKKTYAVRIGDLDPAGEPSGARMRLEHLGYYAAVAARGDAAQASRDAAQLASALRAFQSDQGLPATGAIDDATRAALVAAHGS